MAKIDLAVLKTKFQSGDIPTQADFEDLIDTCSASGGTGEITAVAWANSADFNAVGHTTTDGIQTPSTNNELKLAYFAGLAAEQYSDMTHIDMSNSSNIVVSNGVAKLAESINTGTGVDGDVTISVAANWNTGIFSAGRTVADAVAFTVTSLGTNFAIVNAVPTGLAVGDEVMLINTMGTSTAYVNAGTYEFLYIASIDTTINKVVFTSNKTKYFGTTASNDANIGVTAGTNQIVSLQRVPNYNTFTLNPSISLTCTAYNKLLYGIIMFRAKTANIYGTINVSGKGYQGQSQSAGWGIAAQATVGGAGACSNYNEGDPTGARGSGGGHVTAGASGTNGSSTLAVGAAMDTATSTKLIMGGAGGGVTSNSCIGGHGGGVIRIDADVMILNGTLNCKGAAGMYAWNNYTVYGGGGAGGTIQVFAYTLTKGTNSLQGTGDAIGKQGGTGKIQVAYKESTGATLTSSPAATATLVSTYAATATLQSFNILVDAVADTLMDTLKVCLPAKPIDVTVNLQISNNASSWYSVTGTLNGVTALNAGDNTFDITALGWSGLYFYYRYNITNTGSSTCELDYLTLGYSPKAFYSTDQKWTSAAYSTGTDKNIRPTALDLNWTKDVGNFAPKVKLIGSNDVNFSTATYFPGVTDYFQDGTAFDINNHEPLSLLTTINTYMKYWKVEVVLNAGANDQVSPTVQSVALDYSLSA
jgi:hypothetical protein